MKYLDEKALNGQHDKQFMLILNHYLTSDWAHKLSEQVSVTSSTSHTSSLHYPYYNISTMKIYSIAAAMTIASANAAKDSHLRHLQDAADTPADASITDLEMMKGSKKSSKVGCSPEAFHGLYRYQSTSPKFTKLYSVIFTDEDCDSDDNYPAEAESCGKFYLGADGLYGDDAGIQAGADDNCFGSYTEDNFEEEDGVCKFDLGKNLTCPRLNDEGPENGGYTAIASTRPGKPVGFIEVEFLDEDGSFGPRFPIKFN